MTQRWTEMLPVSFNPAVETVKIDKGVTAVTVAVTVKQLRTTEYKNNNNNNLSLSLSLSGDTGDTGDSYL